MKEKNIYINIKTSRTKGKRMTQVEKKKILFLFSILIFRENKVNDISEQVVRAFAGVLGWLILQENVKLA
jgi:hypothetical protein